MISRYDAYKDSGVEWIGEIPEHWEVIALKHIVATKITDGPHITPEFIEEGIPFLSVESVQENMLNIDKMRGYISEEKHLEYSVKSRPQRNDILFVKSGSTTGKSAMVLTDAEFSIWSPLCIIRSDENKATAKFVFCAIQSFYFRRLVEVGWSFGTQPNIGMGVIENLAIVVPPINEQTQIVSYLDEKTALIDNLISVKQRKIELLRGKRTALINQAVTKGLNPNAKMKDSGIEWIGEIPEHWVVKKMKYVSSIVYGISPPDTTYNSDGIGTVLVNGPVEYSESDFGETRSLKWTTAPVKFAKKGSLLFCLRGSTTGRMNITHMDLSIGRGVCSINSNENQWFLIYSMLMVRIWIQEQISGSTFPSVTKDDVDNFSICSPPITEQTQIVSYLDEKTKEIDDLLNLEQKKIDLLKEYRQSLISEVVTGKTKVVNELLNEFDED